MGEAKRDQSCIMVDVGKQNSIAKRPEGYYVFYKLMTWGKVKK